MSTRNETREQRQARLDARVARLRADADEKEARAARIDGSAFTARNYQFGEAPKKITLLGEKLQRPEPAQHIIEFPGGAIEVSRLEDGSYWAHVIVNRSWAHPSMKGMTSAYGEVVGSRVTRRGMGGDISDIADFSAVEQIAVLIRPTQHRETEGRS